MKVAYLFSRYPVPSQTFCDTEMRALEAMGYEVEIYSCSPPTSSFRHGAEDRPRGPVFYAPPGAALDWREAAARQNGTWPEAAIADYEARFGARYKPARRAQHAVYFADLLKRRGVEHLHVHFANRATYAALFIHGLTALPFSFTAHAQDFLVDLGSDALLNEMCARATFVVAVSDWSRRELVKRCPGAEPKIHRVYNGLPLERWPRPEQDAPPAHPPLQIFSIGRLVAFKGFDDLIAACAELRARGVEFRCEIAGEGPLRDTLEHQISTLSIRGCVRLVGLLSQSEIRARLASCHVFALACRTDEKGACDVLPTVILEAMAAGRPVVSTRLAGVPEMVDDGQTGRLVAPGDVRGLADALQEFSRDPESGRRMGRAGRRKLEAKFCSAQNVRQLADLLTRSRRPPTTSPEIGGETICLFSGWPDEGGFDPALLAWRNDDPRLRLLALLPGGPPNAPETLALIPAFEFLPDAMVLEADWRERSAGAQRIESWRGVLGGGPCETEAFLRAARAALYLHHHWNAAGHGRAAHLHAVGARAVWCAWVLGRLGAVAAASFYLAPGEVGSPELSGSMLRRLAGGFGGGWVAGERKLAATLGANFRGDDAPADPAQWRQWAQRL